MARRWNDLTATNACGIPWCAHRITQTMAYDDGRRFKSRARIRQLTLTMGDDATILQHNQLKPPRTLSSPSLWR
jgi:hypothetical protein